MPQREDIRLAPPDFGWDVLMFCDGYVAQIVGGISFVKDGENYVKYLLFPYEELKKRYQISEDELTKSGCIEKVYLKEMIKTINEDDPIRKIKFSMLNFKGEKTPVTAWFMGYEQNKEIVKLRGMLEQVRVHNAVLMEENLILKTNIPKFIKTNFSALAGDLMPMFKEYILAKEEAQKKMGG